jgi:hypothetical protein
MSNINEIVAVFIATLPPHKCSLSITHNQHKDYYQTVAEYVDDLDDWVSSDERDKATAADEVWEIQWYPDTPIRSYRTCASSLAAVLLALSSMLRDRT